MRPVISLLNDCTVCVYDSAPGISTAIMTWW